MASINPNPLPELCIRLRSWCDLWVSLEDKQADSQFSPVSHCEVLANKSGRFPDLPQVLLECQSEREFSCLLALQPRPDGKYNLQIRTEGGAEGLSAVGQSSYLGLVGRRVCLKERSGLDTAFTIHFSDNNSITLRGGSENLYLSADSQGRIYTGPTTPRKWEWFAMVPVSQSEAQISRLMPLPVRVHLRGHNGRYLCTSHSTVSALAEVPCCCEEFLLEVGPIYTPSHSNSTWSTIRNATGNRLLSADPAGALSVVPGESARGRENFMVHMTCPKWPRVAILHRTLPDDVSLTHVDRPTTEARAKKNQTGTRKPELLSYVGVESNGRVVSNRADADTWQQFALELVSGSRVFIRGVNGRFFAGEKLTVSGGRVPVSCASCEAFDCWEVRSHGDGLYSFVLTPVERTRGDTCLFVDEFGKLQQSSEPSVQFPATCSLFLLEPVARKVLDPQENPKRPRNPAKELLAHLSRRGTNSQGFERVLDEQIVGFSIRTAGKVSGRERFLSVEPNGAVTASRTKVGRSEVFSLGDVNALAARNDAATFPCRAAAHAILNPLQNPPTNRPTTAHRREAARAAEEAAAREAQQELSRQRQQVHTAARAVSAHAPNPKARPAQLRELCAEAITTEAARRLSNPPRCNTAAACLSSWGVQLPYLRPTQPRETGKYEELGHKKALLDGTLDALLESAAPPCCYNGAFSMGTRVATLRAIPDDLLAQIDGAWRGRQMPVHSCKRHVAGRRRARARGRAARTLEGFVCSQCMKPGLAKLDPVSNPGHHRFLDVQRRLGGFVGPSPRPVMNPLTMTAIGMVSTLLCISRAQRPRARAARHAADSE